MKKILSLFLAVFLLVGCVLVGSPEVLADKKQESRAIAIVFDNSGSMHDKDLDKDGTKDQEVMDWCRAIYSMEVFGSMLNEGDILQIYPMHPISINGQKYTMDKPYQLTNAEKASDIRTIMAEKLGGTPIATIDKAAEGIKKVSADKKYLVILTDGDKFSEIKDGKEQDLLNTQAELQARMQKYATKDLTVMYLGISDDACMPGIQKSDYYIEKKAADTAKVLSTLTEMCNLIFGRDILPAENVTDNSLEFDMSMKKLIVFVQGENISGLKITGKDGANAGQQISALQTKYSEKATSEPGRSNLYDQSLQGMIVTYEGSTAGKYSIDYSGTPTSVEVYYEPDADLEFIFTDSNGNLVDPNALYEGEYKVSFGMKDGKTGQLIESKLLGNPVYEGSYSIKGEVTKISESSKFSGEIPVNLMMGDKFEAELMVTYLSGYTIRKDSSDFGWPEGGITVAARPAGDLKLEITGGQELYSLQDLEEGEPFIAKVYHQGQQLTGQELEKVELKWDPDTSNAEIKQQFADDHYILTMHYKDPSAPQNTTCGVCTVTIHAFYAAQGSAEAQAQTPLTYNINDDFSPLQLELIAPQDYILISELDESEIIRVNLTLDGARLTPEDFENVELKVDCDIANELIPCVEDSAYEIKLASTPGIEKGKHTLTVTGYYTDHIGRETHVDEDVDITLGNMPRWLKWVIALGILLLLIILLIIILNLPAFPKYINKANAECSMSFNGQDVSNATTFKVIRSGKQLQFKATYGGLPYGLKMDVKPGKNGKVKVPSKKRSLEVTALSVSKVGPATMTDATVGSKPYELDHQTNKLKPADEQVKPFEIRNGTTVDYSGTIVDAGLNKSFAVSIKMLFKK